MARVCVFDAYGTLFDVAAAARLASAGQDWAPHWPKLAADWRRKQLEYTWLRAVAAAHADFWQVTQDALDWALEASGLADAALRGRLLGLYRELPAFPEVPAMLEALAGQGHRLAILSNGSPGMLAAAVRHAGLEGRFAAVMSVEEVGVFKPDARVYGMVGPALGVRPDEVVFVSSNGWDACSGAAFGFRSVWVNREGAPMDRLHGRPSAVLGDLAALPGWVAGL
jgi:2-haloacid dehalogenase